MRKLGILYAISFLVLINGPPVFGQQAGQPPQYRQEAAPVSIQKISPHVYEIKKALGVPTEQGFWPSFAEVIYREIAAGGLK
jgi:hypothetical protein